jgi:hypothetical protein
MGWPRCFDHAIGSLGRPLTDAELDAKVQDLCAPMLGEAGSRKLIAQSRAIKVAPGLGAIIAAAIPA